MHRLKQSHMILDWNDCISFLRLEGLSVILAHRRCSVCWMNKRKLKYWLPFGTCIPGQKHYDSDLGNENWSTCIIFITIIFIIAIRSVWVCVGCVAACVRTLICSLHMESSCKQSIYTGFTQEITDNEPEDVNRPLSFHSCIFCHFLS